jgi:hypothetical protein
MIDPDRRSRFNVESIKKGADIAAPLINIDY